MKSKSKPIVFLAAFALSITLISGSGYAGPSMSQVKETVYSFEGTEFRALGRDPQSEPPDPNAVELEADQDKIMAEQERGDEIAKLKDIIKENAPEHDGGSYIDEDGNVVYFLTSSNLELEKQLILASAMPEKVKINYVKYTENQLKEATNTISSLTDSGIVMGMVNIKENKVAIFISEKALNINRNQIIKHIPEDMIDWQLGEFRVVDQAATIYPGEQIERKLSGTSYLPCSSAFSAKHQAALQFSLQ